MRAEKMSKTAARGLDDEVDESPRALLKSWMVYALAFSVVYSLIAWPCVVSACRKPSPAAAAAADDDTSDDVEPDDDD